MAGSYIEEVEKLATRTGFQRMADAYRYFCAEQKDCKSCILYGGRSDICLILADLFNDRNIKRGDKNGEILPKEK